MSRPVWNRPTPQATGPDRAPAGLFRRPDSARRPGLSSVAQDEMFRVIKGAYDIADRQIERGRQAARTLREASVAAGLGEPVDGLRLTERLGQDTLMLLMEWVTLMVQAGPSALGRQWLGRLPEAEGALAERLLGALLRPGAAARAPSPSPAPAAEAPAAPTAPTAPATPGSRWPFQIRHEDRKNAPPVAAWFGMGELPDAADNVVFASATNPGKQFEASFTPAPDGQSVLSIKLPLDLPAGIWRAALCQPDGTQTGHLQFEL